ISNETKVQFDYLEQLYDNKLLFVVEQKGNFHLPRKLLVKFVGRFEVEAHKACANLGIAPQLFGYQRIPGKRHMIVMEFLEDYECLSLREPIEVKNAVKEAVKKMHDSGFVHGDLRNIKKGGNDSDQILRHPDAYSGYQIQQEHDEYMVGLL
ncbi:12854_t:CDS:2, partial [Ambispora leptoticha]